jgi:hypothetical protein
MLSHAHEKEKIQIEEEKNGDIYIKEIDADTYNGDYDGDGKVSYNEAILYAMEHYTDSFISTNFINSKKQKGKHSRQRRERK